MASEEYPTESSYLDWPACPPRAQYFEMELPSSPFQAVTFDVAGDDFTLMGTGVALDTAAFDDVLYGSYGFIADAIRSLQDTEPFLVPDEDSYNVANAGYLDRLPLPTDIPKDTLQAATQTSTSTIEPNSISFSPHPSQRTKRKRGRPRIYVIDGDASDNETVNTGGDRIISSPSVLTTARPTYQGPPGDANTSGFVATKKRGQNRAAVCRYRSRRETKEQDLKDKVEEASKHNRKLLEEIQNLCKELLMLKSELLEHKNCDCLLIQTYLLREMQTRFLEPME